MKLTVINGTNRVGNKTLNISQAVMEEAQSLGHEARLVDLNNFGELFRGKYLENLSEATPGQRMDLENMAWAKVLIFVVPTYHHSLPGSLKNFLDLFEYPPALDKKVVGVIASGRRLGVDGARAAVQALNGVFAYEKLTSFVVPKILKINFEEIDHQQIAEFLTYLQNFLKI